MSGNLLEVPKFETKRKFSIPVCIGSLLPEPGSSLTARRRLSNVSDAVTRKLSTTIGLGWRNHTIPTQTIIDQGRHLAVRYVLGRTRRSGSRAVRRVALQRLRNTDISQQDNSEKNSQEISAVTAKVYPILLAIGLEMERSHPSVYTHITRQACMTPMLTSNDAPATILCNVSRGIFKQGITWPKIVSLFCICGGLAVDCLQQSKADALPRLIEAFGEIVEYELIIWINAHGGWMGLCNKYQQHEVEESSLTYITTILIGLIKSSSTKNLSKSYCTLTTNYCFCQYTLTEDSINIICILEPPYE
ncbi:uncharacterized protein LOC113363024 [Ctenocephalides felis]|uniref:uncharacterized protein LOC113363023 n=1 Tax=Ctenocephalides felis TaxID=7515 RepID=UPI000E6E5921|nr:uncharacterized protein LOC113363023 [Ctenocephalides felis]XP_026461300.1 uncharacterized protein LOC113363024 [Ctenocephalides felis]